MSGITLERPDATWKRFVVEHGHGASAHDLAFILQRSVEEIAHLRASGACSKGAGRKNFVELFQLRHGRDPEENDWPPPRRIRRGEYEWQVPELALLASLVGRLGKTEIAQTLTARLQLLTHDPEACRGVGAVQSAIGRIGMQSADVVGGITTVAAGREIGSLAVVNQTIHKGDLRPVRVGRRWVIPHDAWAACAHSGDRERSFRSIVNTGSGDHEHPLALRRGALASGTRSRWVATTDSCPVSSLVGARQAVSVPLASFSVTTGTRFPLTGDQSRP